MLTVAKGGYCLLLGSEKNRDRSLFGAVRAVSDPVAIMLPNGTVNTHRFADIVIDGNPNHPDRALAAVKRYQALTGSTPKNVVPLTEMTLSAGLAIARAYDLPYLSDAVFANARDKFLQKQAFEKIGLDVPQFAEFSSFAELQSIAERFRFPVVLKPRNAGGSEGVRMVATAKELLQGFNHLTNATKGYEEEYRLSGTAFQIEEFVDSQCELSVEILNTVTARHVIAVTDKYLTPLPYFAEVGHSVPSVWSHDELVRTTALKACEALGIDRGLVHVEMKISKAGTPVMMEVNARPGGGSIPDLIETITGKNVFELHCKSYVQDTVSLPPLTARGRAATAFLKAEAGIIDDIIIPTRSELPVSVVVFKLWAKKGDVSPKCIDSNTRGEGYVEFYWPEDKVTERLKEHLVLASEMTKKYIKIRAARVAAVELT